MNSFYFWSVLVIVLVFLFTCLLIYLYAKFLKHRKTKEYYAFFVVGPILILILNSLTLIQGNGILTELLVFLLSKFFEIDPNLAEASNFDKVIVLIMTLAFIGLTMYFYKNWPSQSNIEARNIRIGKGRIGIIEGTKINIQIIKGDIEIELYQPEQEEDFEIFQNIDDSKLPFHIQVGRLLMLSDNQYNIDLGSFETSNIRLPTDSLVDFGKDWYNDLNCFYSSYGDKRCIIYCGLKNPDDVEINKIEEFALSEKNVSFILIVTEREVGNELNIKNVGDVKVKYQTKNYLIQNLINFDPFFRYLSKYFYETQLPNSKLCLGNIYTPLSAQKGVLNDDSVEIEWKDSIVNVEKHVLNWIKNEGYRNEHLAILGEYGQGKSVFSVKLCLEILNCKEEYNRIPIIIELRGLSPRNMNLLNLLSHFGNQHGISASSLFQLHLEGKLLIILEAFDEMDLVGDTEILMLHFQQLWQFARTPKSKIIITGRPNLFIDNKKRRRALGVSKKRNYLPYTRAIHLKPMSELQIKDLLREVEESTSKQIISALETVGLDSSFGELVSRPSTLFQLSVIWNEEFQKKGVEKINAAAVIEKFIQNDYDRQEAKFLSKGEKPLITSDERSYFMMGIAVGMMLKDGYKNQVKETQLTELIKLLFKEYPTSLPPYKDSSKGIHASILTNRMSENRYALDSVISDVLASGILVLDLSGSDVFKFSHKSYLELLISKFYSGFILKDYKDEYESTIILSIKKAFYFKESSLVYSVDVNNFVAQFISNKIIQNKQELKEDFNENSFAKEVHKKVFPKFYSSIFPKFQNWLFFYPKLFRLQLVATIFLLIPGLAVDVGFQNFYSSYFFLLSIIFGTVYLYLLEINRPSKLLLPLNREKINSYHQRIDLFNRTLSQLRVSDNGKFISYKVLKILKSDELQYSEYVNCIKFLKLFSVIITSALSTFLCLLITNSKPEITRLLIALSIPTTFIYMGYFLQYILLDRKFQSSYLTSFNKSLDIIVILINKGLLLFLSGCFSLFLVLMKNPLEVKDKGVQSYEGEMVFFIIFFSLFLFSFTFFLYKSFFAIRKLRAL